MNNTELNLNQPQPVLTYKVNTGPVSLPFDVETDLQKYSRIFITKEFDPFRIVHSCEAPFRDYKVYGETKDGDKKVLFTSVYHYECCNCCEQCIIGELWCGYACCDTIESQMDYMRNGEPFYTQGEYITKGCHCCDMFLLCKSLNLCFCSQALILRENVDPDSPNVNIGRRKGKTQLNSCCSCDKYAQYYNENNLKGHRVRADCCDICKNNMVNSCCVCCSCCVQGCDFEMSIENERGVKTGNVRIFAGCCSEKTEGKCCYLPRPYFEVNMPPDATSEQKFHIIADIIHLDLANKIF